MLFFDKLADEFRRLFLLKAPDDAGNLSEDDKCLFEVLCQFVWIQGDPLPLIFDVTDAVYAEHGITLTGLKRLEALGLILFETNGYVKKGYGKHTRLFYCGKPTKIGFPNEANNSLDLGHVLLTDKGKQIFTSIPCSRNQQFYEYVVRRWFQQGLTVASIQIDQHLNLRSYSN